MVHQSSLGESGWELIPTENRRVFKKLEKISDCYLRDVSDVYYGIKTGLNEALIVDEKDVDSLNLEKELLKPILGGEDVKRYDISFKGKFLVFPYIKETAEDQIKYKVVDIKKYKNLYEHLIQYRQQLTNRSDIKNLTSEWYELRPCDYYQIFESEKIITPDISNRNNFAYEEGKYYCLNTCFVIALKNEYSKKSGEYLKYLLGLLNSKSLEFYFKQLSTHIRGMYYRYIKEYLEPLPLIEITENNETLAKQIIQTVSEIIHFKEKQGILGERVRNFPTLYFKDKGEKLCVVAKSAPTKFSKGIYRFSEKDLKIEKIREITGDDSYRLLIAKNEYFAFRTFNEARYVQELLRKKGKITKSELIALEIPTKDELDKIMNYCNQDINRIEEIKDSVMKLENEIDELVYELYGLDSEDRKIIEEHLSKF